MLKQSLTPLQRCLVFPIYHWIQLGSRILGIWESFGNFLLSRNWLGIFLRCTCLGIGLCWSYETNWEVSPPPFIFCFVIWKSEHWFISSLNIWETSSVKPSGPRGCLFHSIFLLIGGRVGQQQTNQILLERKIPESVIF